MKKVFHSLFIAIAMLCGACSAWADEQPPQQNQEKETVEQRQQRRKELFELAIAAQDFDKALTVLDEMIDDKEVGDEEKLMAGYAKFVILVREKKDGAKACAVAKKLAEVKKDDAEVLNELAWTILDTPDLKNRDLDVALEIAKQAAEVSKYENGAILDTLARAYYEKGDLDKAIEYQTKAVEKSQNDEELPDDIKEQVKATLEKYQAEKAKQKS